MWFSWNSLWHSKGASLWSLAAKAAYVTTCTLGSVLRQLVGATDAYRQSIWAPGPQERFDVGRQLDLPSDVVDALFLDGPSTELDGRAHLSLQLRWCPRCAEHWYHCIGFQDRRVLRCPWHEVLLFEGCTRCGRPIDPLGLPWECGFCGERLVPSLTNWVPLFKSHPDHGGAWPSPLPLQHVAYLDEESRVLCLGGDVGRRQFDGRDWAVRYWQQGQLFESGCALADTVLLDHQDCVVDEPLGHMSAYYSQGFRCPVAAGAGAVFRNLGSSWQQDGLWPQAALPIEANGTLPWPEHVPFELMRAMLRELPRRWLADAFLFFGDMAAAGRSTGRWEPAAGPMFGKLTGAMKTAESSALHRTQTVTLLSAKGYAARCCPKHPSKSVADAASLLALR